MQRNMPHAIRLVAMSLLIAGGANCSAANESTAPPIIFHGASDASAGAFLNDEAFVVADDENNVLKVYNLTEPLRPTAVCDLSGFLKTTVDNPEADIEGATRVGDRIYWITSHGRNKDGKERPNRYRFFATDIQTTPAAVTLVPAGRPCKDLVPALLRTPFAAAFGLDKATRLGEDLKKNERERLAPKDEGLNIEALAASADARTLYIGFRNPRPAHPLTGRPQALVVPLTNYRDVIEKASRPAFGEPILWDLGGLGLRSMEYCPAHKTFFLIAGPHDEEDGFVLYRWSGDRWESPVALQGFKGDGFAPEALMPAPDALRLFFLSDDGSRLVRIAHPSECFPGELIDSRTCRNKHLVDRAKRTFRAAFITP